jgi:hypothetical protein
LPERQQLSDRGLQTGRGVRAGERQLTLDPASRILSDGDLECRLTPAQASLMFLLLRAFPEPVRTESIWWHVRGSVPARPTSAVRVPVHELRVSCRMRVMPRPSTPSSCRNGTPRSPRTNCGPAERRRAEATLARKGVMGCEHLRCRVAFLESWLPACKLVASPKTAGPGRRQPNSSRKWRSSASTHARRHVS